MARQTLHYPAPLQGKSGSAAVNFTELHAEELDNFLPEVQRFIRRRPPSKLLASNLIGNAFNQTHSVRVQDPQGNDWAILFYRSATAPVQAVAHRLGASTITPNEVILSPPAVAYLNSAESLVKDIEATTISDTNFIYNRNVTTREEEVGGGGTGVAADVPYYMDIQEMAAFTVHRISIPLLGPSDQPAIEMRFFQSLDIDLTDTDQPPAAEIVSPRVTSSFYGDIGGGSQRLYNYQSLTGIDYNTFILNTPDFVAGLEDAFNNEADGSSVANDGGFEYERESDRFLLLRAKAGATVGMPDFANQTWLRKSVITKPGITLSPGNPRRVAINPPSAFTNEFLYENDYSFGFPYDQEFVSYHYDNPDLLDGPAFADTPWASSLKPTTVATYGALPAEGPENVVFTVEDTGRIYVYDPTFGTGGGFRELASAPDGLDVNTMPMGATYDIGTNQWTIDTLPWEKKTSSPDPELIPDPSFLGQSIRDIGLFRGRLALLHRKGITLSASSNDLSFYPTSPDTATAGDPIDLKNTLARDTVFHWLVPYNRRLFVLAQDAILEVVSTSGVLTVETVELKNVTGQPCSAKSRPFSSSGILFFATDTGEETINISEFSITASGSVTLSEDQTADTSNILLPLQLAGEGFISLSHPSLFFGLYLVQNENKWTHHSFRKVQGQRVQNAFVDTSFPSEWNIMGILPVSSSIVGMHYQDVTGNINYVELDYSIANKETLLDAYITGTPTLLPTVPPQTRFNLPHFASNMLAPLVVSRNVGGSYPQGYLAVEEERTPTTITVKGDWTNEDAVVGFPYSSRWTLPEPLIFTSRDRSNNVPSLSTQSVITGAQIGFKETGAFEVLSGDETIGDFSVDTGLEEGNEYFMVGETIKDLSLSIISVNHEPATLLFTTLYARSFGRT